MFGKKMVEGKARILACEGVTSGNSGTDLHGELWMHYKFIVEVHPAGGSAFRAETKVRAAHAPNVGDLVGARYDVGSQKVELVLEGDPRYDPKLRRAAKKAARDELLHGSPGSTRPATYGAGLDPELQELMDLEEAERRAATSAPPAAPTAQAAPAAPAARGSSASRMDRLQQLGELRAQGILSDIEFEQEKARILSEP